MSINRQYFSRKQIEKKEHYKLLDVLMGETYGSGEHYNDIRIRPEEDAFIIEWSQESYNDEFGFNGKFVYLEPDQVVMTEYSLPDNTSIFFETEEEYSEYLKEWLEKNPGWEKNQFGMWTNRIENEKFMEELNKSKEVK